MEENTNINTYFPNWCSKGPLPISFDWKDVIAQARINEALNDLENRGLISIL